MKPFFESLLHVFEMVGVLKNLHAPPPCFWLTARQKVSSDACGALHWKSSSCRMPFGGSCQDEIQTCDPLSAFMMGRGEAL